jgi:hypothetical protein
MIFSVRNVEDKKTIYIEAENPEEALRKALGAKKDFNVKSHGNFLFVVVEGKTYCVNKQGIK